jgi:predicted small integral membrane protein
VQSPAIKRITQAGQTALVLTLGVYFMLVVFGNITDYGTNFQFVKHVLSMDSIPSDPHIAWRAIKSEPLYHLTYVILIVWEALAGSLGIWGGMRMAIRLGARDFDDAKSHAIAGLWVGMLLWSLAFITIGGEWFMMWESASWSGELAAWRMFTLNSIALLFLQVVKTDAKPESIRNDEVVAKE